MSKKVNNQIKNLAKMAKERLKSGFWEDYKDNVKQQVTMAKEEGENPSGVIKYYKEKASRVICDCNQDDEQFYLKVKSILDEFGDVSDMIGRLCDDDYYNSLDFVQKERYIFELASRYRLCKIRYDEETRYNFSSRELQSQSAV